MSIVPRRLTARQVRLAARPLREQKQAHKIARRAADGDQSSNYLKFFNFFERGRCPWITEAGWSKRRQLIAAAGPAYTKQEWLQLCHLCDYRCLCCGEKKPLTVDHIVPLSKGGKNDIGNLQPLCQSCNSRKATKTIDFRNF